MGSANDLVMVRAGGWLMAYHLDDPGVRERVCEWVEANGLDRHKVAVPGEVVIDKGTLTVQVYELDRNGHRFTRDGVSAARTTHTVPLVADPPPGWRTRLDERLAEWRP